MSNRWSQALLAAAFACGVAYAQQKGPLESTLEQFKVVKAADGREALEPAASVRPGDVIEYVATYRNTGRAPVTGVQATVPVPPNTEYVPGSTRPADAKASVDGTAFAAMPLVRKAVRDGKTVEERIPYREYHYLRWSSPEIAAGQSARFTARVRVLDDASPPAAAKGGVR
jgi:uncharacterized repeat protein (TIGR01451 family)